ncbi:hypothetical protein J6590_074737 [Homalodisca vitripennis]|nr:hypothetical protein J6590_074737 [Homalodisca vitripennis]
MEGKIKKHTTLLTDKECIEIFKSCATVIHLGQECPMLDWKEAVSATLRGETNYNVDSEVGKNINKPGKQLSTLIPKPVKEGVPIKKSKLKDLNTLLTKHFTKEWENNQDLTFFKNLFDQQKALSDPQDNESDIGEIDDTNEELAICTWTFIRFKLK